MREYNKRPVAHRKKLALDREYRKKNLAEIRAYDRKRAHSLERKALVYACNKIKRNGNRQEYLANSREYYQKNKTKWPEKAAKQRARFTKEEWREIQSRYGLKHRHGLTFEQYEKLLAHQDGKCALCPTEHGTSGQNGKLHVDHNHRTKRNRGLLCNRCNGALERAESIPGWLERALVYLATVDAEHVLGVVTSSFNQREGGSHPRFRRKGT
jgi:hypothetical protein